MVAAAEYCIACGRPRADSDQQLQTVSRRTGVPLDVLRQEAWNRSVLLGTMWQSIAWLETRSNELTERINRVERRSVAWSAAATFAPSPAPPATAPVPPEEWPEPEIEIAAATATPAFEVAPEMASAAVLERSILALPLEESPEFGEEGQEEGFAEAFEETPAPRFTPSSHAPRTAADIEQMVSGRGLAVVGGLAIVLGAIFFLSLAFSRGWIGPTARVVIGVAAATAMMLVGARFFGRREAVLGHVMTAVGLGVMSLSMFAATRLYDLIPVELGVAGSLAAAGLAAIIAIRANLQIVAAYGLITALAAPPLLGAEANGATIALLATTLIGTTSIALYRTWTWLPPLAFLLAAPQLGDWLLSDPNLSGALLALFGFWLLHAIASGGEAFRFSGTRLQPTSATLLVANAAFLIWGGAILLDGEYLGWRGAFLLAVAVVHGALGGWFLFDRGRFDPFGMLAFGTGVAALTMAIPVQFGGPVVAIAFAAEAVALAWVASRLDHPYSGAAAALLGALSVWHLVLFEYPFNDIADPVTSAHVFLNANGMTLAFQLLALAAAGCLVRITSVRYTLAAVGIALTSYVLPFELSAVWLIAGWVALAAVGLLLLTRPELAASDALGELPGRLLLMAAAAGAWVAALGHLLTIEYPPSARSEPDHSPPFLNTSALAFALVLAPIALAAFKARAPYRLQIATIGFGLLIYGLPFELSGVPLVAAWSAASLAALASERWSVVPRAENHGRLTGVNAPLQSLGVALPATAAWLLAAGHVLLVEIDLDHLLDGSVTGTPFTDAATLATAIVIAAAIAGSMLVRPGQLEWGARLAALIMASILVPYELGPAAAVVAWSLLTVVAVSLDVRSLSRTAPYLMYAGLLWFIALSVAIERVAPPNRLLVDDSAQGSSIDHPLFWSGATAAFGALAAAAAYAYWQLDREPKRVWFGMVAGALVVYLLSIGVVDYVQGQLGEEDLESLQKRAQVALSILWAALGGLAFAAGIVRRSRATRLFGLGLLGLATIKVFLYDTASLDASYRVLSLIALGLLLLGSSYLYLRYVSPLDQAERTSDDLTDESAESTNTNHEVRK